MILQHFIRQFPGSSFPSLIETQEGLQCILKMRGAGNGPISLISEFIANKAAHRIGWPVPDAYWVQIPDHYPWVFGTDEFDDIVQKSYGWNLGIEYIPEAVQIRRDQLALIPVAVLDHMYSLDLFFINVDRTEAACNLLLAPDGQTWIIDHGMLALFQLAGTGGRGLFSNHIFHSVPGMEQLRYDDALHRPEMLEEIVGMIPEPVLQEAGATREGLMEQLKGRMGVLGR